MKGTSWLRMLLPILAIVSLVLGPLAAQANGSAIAVASTAAMMGEMPCSPPIRPIIPDCQKACPLMVGCLAKSIPAAPVFSVLEPVFGLVADMSRPSSDAFAASLGMKPLIRPPRS